MSDNCERLEKFEEDNFIDLAEKFIDKNRDAWEQFVYDRYCDWIANQEPPDYDDDYIGQDKGCS